MNPLSAPLSLLWEAHFFWSGSDKHILVLVFLLAVLYTSGVPTVGGSVAPARSLQFDHLFWGKTDHFLRVIPPGGGAFWGDRATHTVRLQRFGFWRIVGFKKFTTQTVSLVQIIATLSQV